MRKFFKIYKIISLFTLAESRNLSRKSSADFALLHRFSSAASARDVQIEAVRAPCAQWISPLTYKSGCQEVVEISKCARVVYRYNIAFPLFLFLFVHHHGKTSISSRIS